MFTPNGDNLTSINAHENCIQKIYDRKIIVEKSQQLELALSAVRKVLMEQLTLLASRVINSTIVVLKPQEIIQAKSKR